MQISRHLKGLTLNKSCYLAVSMNKIKEFDYTVTGCFDDLKGTILHIEYCYSHTLRAILLIMLALLYVKF